MSKAINNILIPNVTKTPQHKKVDAENRLPKQGQESEFSKLLGNLDEAKPLHGGINLSSHAVKRLAERKIDFNGDEYTKVKNAVDRLKAKGSQNSLVVSDKAAYIVDVQNNKVITAVDKESMTENVFTKIDSTVFVN
ncbi:MAG: TIGR02530 family flagellar biosynthesis protein [Bdellovibrionota bacterium]|nr:TIGR02530 family flagellar biosynthesis protein [Bdellovibrionota bacterium]